MQDEQTEQTVDRRRLLRRVGTVAAGVAGAGVAGAVVATPAQAVPTAVLTETTNTGGTAAVPTVRLENPLGAALSVAQSNSATVNPEAAPAGSMFVDDFGDFGWVGDDGTGKLFSYALSTKWAKYPELLPVPQRALYTAFAATRTRVLNPAALDSLGRLRGGQTLHLNLSDLVFLADGVMATVAAIGPTAAGFLTVFPYGMPRPGTANVGFERGRNANSFVVVGAGFDPADLIPDTAISIFASQTTHVIVDVFGFVVRVPWQLNVAADASVMSQSAEGASMEEARRAALSKRLPELRKR